LKVDGENGSWLEEKSSNYYDVEDTIDENHFLFALTKGDREKRELHQLEWTKGSDINVRN
jgi:hypothetical protein